MNHSLNSSTLEGPDVLYAASVTALLLVPPINIYTLLLIVRGGLETITSEFYCLNLAVSDILICFFCLFYVIGKHLQVFLTVSSFFLGFQNIARPLFQGCICVERYLAVVHPLIFLRYKLLRYKIICCCVVWFITLGFCISFIYYFLIQSVIFKVYQGFYTVLLTLMMFCCVSVLWALKQPGPAQGRSQRTEGNDAKRRAFNIIMITTGIFVIEYLPYGVLLFLYGYIKIKEYSFLFSIILSLSIFAGVINPLFFLQRAAKLPSLNLDIQRFMLRK